MTTGQDYLLSFWLRAVSEPLGLWLRTSDRRALSTRLYLARDRSGPVRDSIAHLQLRTSPRDPEHELWIVNPQRASSAV